MGTALEEDLREEMELLSELRYETLDRVEAGDEAAVAMVLAVGDLIIDREDELANFDEYEEWR